MKNERLNLGCGNDIREGYVNIDSRKLPGVDKVLDLNKAAKEVKKALKACPDSLPVDKLLKAIKSDQDKARRLVKETNTATKAARFEEADTKLRQIDALWPGVSNLSETKKELAKIRGDYGKQIAEAWEAKGAKDLDEALQAANGALSMRIDSPFFFATGRQKNVC